MKPVVIAVVGGKKSGKTTAIEILTKELTIRGYRVAAVKHIPESNFTIDKEGKDTWRYAQSGAMIVIGVSADEIATMEKVRAKTISLEDILQRCKGSDIVFLEGFRKSVSRNRSICKIVIAKSLEDFEEASVTFDPILAFIGPYSPKKSDLRVPYVDIFKNAEKIADLVEKWLKRKL
jgi:molybdopterin-guanine dinucleotide biosynthesis protein B